ncbi:MAG TPA: hypothetical protein VF713_13615 [Thermoanaerobaculia bacterium]
MKVESIQDWLLQRRRTSAGTFDFGPDPTRVSLEPEPVPADHHPVLTQAKFIPTEHYISLTEPKFIPTEHYIILSERNSFLVDRAAARPETKINPAERNSFPRERPRVPAETKIAPTE